jgi:hypothetical protein
MSGRQVSRLALHLPRPLQQWKLSPALAHFRGSCARCKIRYLLYTQCSHRGRPQSSRHDTKIASFSRKHHGNATLRFRRR